MNTITPAPRHGMTLVELLVVIVILGLLGVAVGPLVQGRQDRRQFAEAAGVVSAVCNEAIAKGIGSSGGAGIWLEAEVDAPLAVSTLSLSRPRPNVSGSLDVTAVTATSATISFAAPPSPATGVIDIVGFSVPYRLASATSIEFLDGYSAENAAFPPVASGYQFHASIPPQRRTAGGRRQLGRYCVDLSMSTIGVDGYTAPAEIEALAGVRYLAITFDVTGRATTAWITTDPAGVTSWQRHLLDAQRPVALLVGQRSRVGAQRLDPADQTEDQPGPNIQSYDAVWVVIDPRASVIRTVPNQAVPYAPQQADDLASRAYSQGLVAAFLKNQ